MKIKFLILTFIFTLISCNSGDNIENSIVSLETAQAEQFISLEIGDRNIRLTEFKDSAWPFWGRTVQTDSLAFDSNSQRLISRGIYASLPKDLALEGHIETFGLEFNQIFNNTDIDMSSNKVLSNKQFQSDFLKIGEQEITLSNFAFAQTYVIGMGDKNSYSFKITKIESVFEHDSLIFVSGEFSGELFEYGYGTIIKDFEFSNGKFKVLIGN